MRERLSNNHLEGMSIRETLEMQSPEYLIALRKALLDKISDYESDVHMINDVLDGYGEENIERGRE